MSSSAGREAPVLTGFAGAAKTQELNDQTHEK